MWDEVPSFPAQEAHNILYLQHLSESVQSKLVIEEAVNALSWLHPAAPISGLLLVQASLARHRRELAHAKGHGGGSRT